MDDDFFRSRVDHCLESISRARAVFLISNIGVIIVLAANFNLYGTWLRRLVTRTAAPGYERMPEAVARARIEDTSIVSVPLLGLKFFVGDVGLIAAVAFFVLSIWMYYALRREQHSVGKLAAELLEPPPSRLSTKGRARPGMEARTKFAAYALSTRFLFVTTGGGGAVGDDARKREPVLAHAFWLLDLAPAWVVFLSGVLDLLSLPYSSALLPCSHGSVASCDPDFWPGEASVRIILTMFGSFAIAWVVNKYRYFHKWTERWYKRIDNASHCVLDSVTSSPCPGQSNSVSRNEMKHTGNTTPPESGTNSVSSDSDSKETEVANEDCRSGPDHADAQIAHTRIASPTSPISNSELLDFFQTRYNHITGLRSTTARHYLTLVGLMAAVLAALAPRSFADREALANWVRENTYTVGIIFFVPALVGVFTIIYDAAARKVAAGSAEAIYGLIGHRQKFDKFPRRRQNLFGYVGEELFFAAPVIAVTSALVASGLSCVATSPTAIPMFASGDAHFAVSWSTVFCIALGLFAAVSVVVFRLYPIAGWALADSSRNPVREDSVGLASAPTETKDIDPN